MIFSANPFISTDPPNSPAMSTDNPAVDQPIPAEDAPKPFMRTIKSFIRRAGRTTAGQAKAFEVLGPQFLLPYQTSLLDLHAPFAIA